MMQEQEIVHQRHISVNNNRAVCILYFTSEPKLGSGLRAVVLKVLKKTSLIKTYFNEIKSQSQGMEVFQNRH